MAEIRIPHSSIAGRGQLTYALLIGRVFPGAKNAFQAFEGTRYKPGARIPEAALHPTDEYPLVPIVIEYAGNDRTGRGHNRSNDVHVLWKFQAAEWIELARVTSQGPEWVVHLMPFVLDHVRGSAVAGEAEIAGRVTRRIMDILDRELTALSRDGRDRAMSFLYDAVTARMAA